MNRIGLEHEGAVQKNCIESLQCHRQTLEQEWSFSFFARYTADFMTKGRDKSEDDELLLLLLLLLLVFIIKSYTKYTTDL